MCPLFSPKLLRLGLASSGLILLFLFSGCGPAAEADVAVSAEPEGAVLEYRLKATMLGYIGMGGEIDEVRNPTLVAKRGERVRITIENGELMVHDVALESHGVASEQILQVGAVASVEFVAETDDTYFCTVPGHRMAGMQGDFRLDSGENRGRLPEKDGRELNTDFERGTLADWTATGEAFAGQPIRGDTVNARRDTDQSGHEGEFWIGTYERLEDGPTGTLTSETFAIPAPFAAFRVGGGSHGGTRVELVLAESGERFFAISGLDREEMRPVGVDLQEHLGEEMFIRIVDEEIGGWGHINFDDFRFYEERPVFPDERDPGEVLKEALPPLDVIAHAGLSAEEAAAAMDLPEDFSVKVAAAEPDVVRPIAMALDDRGRLWVVEGHTYPTRAEEGKGRDRVLILEDTDGDGSLDSRKVFLEGLNLVSGIELGYGGVWLGAAPYLLFVPVTEDGDSPAGEPEVVLDGWGFQDTHETLNSFTWGPDGWLYGCHGIFTHSNVGKPGAPDSERTRINAGYWRYHPTQKRFEVVAHGTSNPWGIDFDDYGEAFATVCVIPHLYHVVPGARYLRQAGEHFNPFTYEDIGTIADHVHWSGNQGPHRGNGRSSAAGGGHAHAGAMVYLGGSWPEEYRNRIFMHNIHGARANTDILAREGSGYAARHGPDFLRTNDSWSQMIDFLYGPSGSVYLLDWYDKNQCHSTNPDVHDKTLGRIFQVSHENDEWAPVNLAEKMSAELVELQLSANDWFVRHARRLLAERGPDPEVHAGLRRIFGENPDVTRKLRALWGLHVTGGLEDSELAEMLSHPEEHVRAWAVRLLVDGEKPAPGLGREFAALAEREESALVRLSLASALQKIPVAERWETLAALVQKEEDAGDRYIPLMLWYALESLVAENPKRGLGVAINAKLPKLLSFTIQRMVAMEETKVRPILEEALEGELNDEQRAVIREAFP